MRQEGGSLMLYFATIAWCCAFDVQRLHFAERLVIVQFTQSCVEKGPDLIRCAIGVSGPGRYGA
jgi:hypothetical protein